MTESMYAAKGVGLAAPQIGVGKRLAVIDISSGEDPAQKLVLINPVISEVGRFSQKRRGLSQLADPFHEVTWPQSWLSLKHRMPKASAFEMTGEDLLARASLHETDHLSGIVHQLASAR